jgi:hypothetical protein
MTDLFVSRRVNKKVTAVLRIIGRMRDYVLVKLVMSFAIDRGVDVQCLAARASRVHGNRGRSGGRRSRRRVMQATRRTSQ